MTTLLLTDDHEIVRCGIKTLLAESNRIEVVGEAANGFDAIRLALELRPAIILMDVRMTGIDGIQATRRILGQLSDARVIALSMYSEAHIVIDAFRAGIRGYLLKDCIFEELLKAIDVVLSGELYLGVSLRNSISLNEIRRRISQRGNSNYLSHREQDVLKLVANGLSTKEIADDLSISNKTVDTHRANIRSKLGLHSTAELTKYAIRSGLTSLD